MQKKTYLQQSLRNGRIVHWIDASMPLKVYIAPFRFYSKLNEEYTYKEMVLRALNEWETASNGKITFQIVTALLNSQINIEWKRVDRQAFGYCRFNIDPSGRLYSAEVQIGISDGVIHQEYMDESEVYHTILHEIGHALGLGHSTNEQDIMFSPHRYGIVNLSNQDKLSLRWLYKFPSNATPKDVANKYNLHIDDLDDIVEKLAENNIPSEFEKVKRSLKGKRRDLVKEQEQLADIQKYNLALQNVKLSTDIRQLFINKSSDLK